MLNVRKIREDFPILKRTINGKPIIYMDSACTTLKPQQVIDALNEYYVKYPACAVRSLHKLGRAATEAYERSRVRIAKFLNAKPDEIIFTKNATESLNLVARTLKLNKGDAVLATDKEHNSSLLPWLLVVKERGIKRFVFPSKPDNTFDMVAFEKAIGEHKPKLVTAIHASNLDGYTIPAREVIKRAHDAGALVVLDGAQSVPHQPIDVRKLDADFIAFSGHKMLGPTGIGVLYVKRSVMDKLEPFMLGGETVTNSTYTSYDLEKPPHRFEAGIQDYSGAMGLAAAAEYLEKIGLENISKHEIGLNARLTKGMQNIPGFNLVGPAKPELRNGIMSFNIAGVDPHTIALMLDELSGIAIRSGQHCVHSWFNAHNIKGTARASLYLYNTTEEIDTFIETMKKIVKVAK